MNWLRSAICGFLALPFVGFCGPTSKDMAAWVDQALRQLEERRERALAECPPDQLRKVAANFDRVQRQLRSLSRGASQGMGEYREFLRDVQVFLSSPAKTLLSDEDRKQLDEIIAWMKREQTLPLERQGQDVPHVVRRVFAEEEAGEHDVFGFSEKLLSLLRSGDIMVRRDDGLWSAWFAKHSQKERRFSHAGITVRTQNGEIHIIHAGGDDLSGGSSRICAVSLDEFLEGSVEAAVYRLPGFGERIARAAEKRIGTPFDPAFDLKTKDRLYCTEMVRDCVNEAAGREVIGTSRKGDFEYVAVDDCYRNEMIKVWDCRDPKPEEKQPIQKLQSRPVVIESVSTTNAPVRRTIRFIPKNGGGR